MMTDERVQALLEAHSGVPSNVTEEGYWRAVARAQAYVRAAQELHDRAKAAEDVSTARMLSAERTLRVARQTLDRLRMLRRGFDRN